MDQGRPDKGKRIFWWGGGVGTHRWCTGTKKGESKRDKESQGHGVDRIRYLTVTRNWGNKRKKATREGGNKPVKNRLCKHCGSIKRGHCPPLTKEKSQEGVYKKGEKKEQFTEGKKGENFVGVLGGEKKKNQHWGNVS